MKILISLLLTLALSQCTDTDYAIDRQQKCQKTCIQNRENSDIDTIGQKQYFANYQYCTQKIGDNFKGVTPEESVNQHEKCKELYDLLKDGSYDSKTKFLTLINDCNNGCLLTLKSHATSDNDPNAIFGKCKDDCDFLVVASENDLVKKHTVCSLACEQNVYQKQLSDAETQVSVQNGIVSQVTCINSNTEIQGCVNFQKLTHQGYSQFNDDQNNQRKDCQTKCKEKEGNGFKDFTILTDYETCIDTCWDNLVKQEYPPTQY